MIEWPKTLRFDRIAAAAEALATGGTRWQHAVLLDPEQFTRVQGRQTGQPVLRVGLDDELQKLVIDLHEATAAYAAMRALPYLETAQKEAVTLHPWTESVNLAPARWGGPYRAYPPDGALAAPVDGTVWRALLEDPVKGRHAWQSLHGFLQALRQGENEPLDRLCAVALSTVDQDLPLAWQGAEFQPVQVCVREAAAALWRVALGDGPEAVLMAEMLTARMEVDLGLPPALAERLAEEERGWRDRATPPDRAVEAWTPWIMELDKELLDLAWQQQLKDHAAAHVLRHLLASDAAIEPESETMWGHMRSFGPNHQLYHVLKKLDPEAAGALLSRYKEESGRFKAKTRRQAAATYLAKLAVLDAFDRWSRHFLKTNMERVELGPEEAGEISVEEGRGALYGFVLGERRSFQAEAPVRHDAGHLFVDLAGFTALTARLKEVEIRQFLRQNFYVPLLGIAKDYYKGGHGVADEGGIRLNNLLGDAVSLGGAPGDLIAFAERATALVQQDLRQEIRDNLDALARDDREAERLRLAEEQRQLRVRRAQGSGDPGEIDARLQELRRALQEVDGHAADRGIDLDLGCFLSYGPSPLDLAWEDDVFGPVHVALAEKINESARGASRDASVERSLAAFAAHFPGRPWAFQVHVGPRIQGDWPEELLDAWPTDPEEVGTLAQSLPGSLRFEGATSLYNTGIALSTDAARAVLKEEVGDNVRVWSGKTPDLIRRLDVRYLMPEPVQHLALVEWRGEQRILRRCGRIDMKGFDRPPLVWEWVGPDARAFETLAGFLAAQGSEQPWEEFVPADS